MKNIPSWIDTILNDGKIRCHKCNNSFSKNSLKAMGVRESQQERNSDYVFIELYCFKCKDYTLFELRASDLIEFAIDVLDGQVSDAKENKKKEVLPPSFYEELKEEMDLMAKKYEEIERQEQRSKITRREINETVKYLNSISYHEDFLIALGMSPEEIDFYRHKRKKKNERKNK